MAKAKKVEKRSAPKKAAKPARVVKDRDDPLGMKRTLREIQKSKPAKKPPIKVTPARYPERVPKPAPEPEQPKVEITVRSVYYDGQFLPALCFRKPGAMHVPCVCGDSVGGVRKFTIPATQHDKSTILQHGYGNFAAPYTPERFANHMRRIASAAPVTPEARALLLPYCPDMPSGPTPAAMPPPDDEAQPVTRRIAPGNGSRAPSGPARTSGKELIRALAAASKLPPEKVRAKLRAAGMRAPYTDETACRKALGVK